MAKKKSTSSKRRTKRDTKRDTKTERPDAVEEIVGAVERLGDDVIRGIEHIGRNAESLGTGFGDALVRIADDLDELAKALRI